MIKTMSNTILKAKQFVKQKFAQSNNHCGHSFQVYEILKDEFLVNDEEILIAGLLHDVLEDTDTSKAELEEEFSPKVVDSGFFLLAKRVVFCLP